MAWGISNPFTLLQQSDMPTGAASQASLFATIGAWINALAGNVPVTAAGVATLASISANTATNLTINFPANRFTAPPVCSATIVAGGPNLYSGPTIVSVTTTQLVVAIYRTGAGTNIPVHWIAVQSP